jgi:hypothetical protein
VDTQTKTETESFAGPAPAAQLPATVAEARQSIGEIERHIARTEGHPKVYPPKIAKAILAVTAEIGQVEKTGKNEFQKYKYASWQEVNNHLSPLLAKHGLIIIQSEKSRSLLEQNEQGSILAIVYECTIVNEDGDAWPPIEWTAIARLRDGKGVSDDKAAPKCATQGEKYFCMKLFKIRTAEEGELDSDADDGTGKAKGRPPKAMGEADGVSAEPIAIYVAKGGAKAWHKEFCAAVRRMATRENLDKLGALNADNVKTLEAADAKLYASAREAYALRLTELPKADLTAGAAQTAETQGATSAEGKPGPTTAVAASGSTTQSPQGATAPATTGKPLPPLVSKAAVQRADAAAAGANPATGELPKPQGSADPGEIPEHLRRMNFGEEAAWLSGIRSMLEAAESVEDVKALQDAAMTPTAKGRMSAGAWAAAIQEHHSRAQSILDNPPAKPFDGDEWLKGDLAGALSAAEDPASLEKVKVGMLLAEKDKLTAPQWKIAVGMYRTRLDEVDPANALGGG